MAEPVVAEFVEDVPQAARARLVYQRGIRAVSAGERRRSALADRLRADLAVSYRPPEYTGELAQIAEAYQRLPRAEREVLALSAWEGLDHGQIAVVLECSRNAVRIRLHRARKRFARELANGQTRSAPPQSTEHSIHVPNGDLA